MKSLKEKLRWPDSAFCIDDTLAGGTATVGLGGDGKDVCIQPFISCRGTENLSAKLSDLIYVNDYVVFDRALAHVPNPRLSLISFRFWFDKLVVLLMLLTGNRKLAKSNILDISLQSFQNPGGKEKFPFDKPLRVERTNFRLTPLAANDPFVSLIDEDDSERWALSLEVFSQVQHIGVRSSRVA